MRPLRSGLWLEDAAIVGVVPASATTLLLRGPRIAPLAAVITNNPTTKRTSTLRPEKRPHGRPSPAQKRTVTNHLCQLYHGIQGEDPNYDSPTIGLNINDTVYIGAQGRDANYNSSANHLNINDTLLLRT